MPERTLQISFTLPRNCKLLQLFCTIGLLFHCKLVCCQFSANHSASIILSATLEVSITRGQEVNMNFTTPNDYQNGVTTQNAATVRVRSNQRFNLSVRSATSHFSSNTSTPMPVSGVLGVRIFPQGQFINLSNINSVLLTNQDKGTNNYNLAYRATPGFNYDAGTYTANIIFTATIQ